jgi:hypothetical protein
MDLARAPTVNNAANFLREIASMRYRGSMSDKQFREALRAINQYVSIRNNRQLEDALDKVYWRYSGFRYDMRKQLNKISGR